jgi:hypothetical protein
MTVPMAAEWPGTLPQNRNIVWIQIINPFKHFENRLNRL